MRTSTSVCASAVSTAIGAIPSGHVLLVEVGGRSRSIHLGSHQFQDPMSRIRAGTRSSRTMVASIKTARAIMKPICLISRIRVNMKDEKTTTMMVAAAVTTSAVRDPDRYRLWTRHWTRSPSSSSRSTSRTRLRSSLW
jgi:hypothetical protein